MKNNIIFSVALALSILGFTACSSDSDEPGSQSAKGFMPMTFDVIYPGQTRATETEFENGDRIGVFVADSASALEIGGNIVNNEPVTLSGGTWKATQSLYWDSGTYNAYAYYPYHQGVSSIDEEPFSVSTDQSAAKTDSALGGYEASDLLYASSKNIHASTSPISLQFRHIMSKLKIRLVKGEDFEGDMPTTAEVYVHNTVPEATVDLSAGVVTRDPKAARQTITAHQESDYTYSAIIVPQRLDNRVPLIEVIMKGVSYIYESKFNFKPGVQHTVSLIISDNPDKVRIEIGGEVVNWTE